MIEKLVTQLKLILRLVRDRRVNPLLKLIPLFTVLYFFIPDPFPLPFEVDDFAVLIIGLYLFVQLCPPEIVEEHLEFLKHGSIPGEDRGTPAGGDVIDTTFRELDPKQDPPDPSASSK